MTFRLATLWATLAACALSAAESPWRTVAEMPADNHDLTAAVVAGQLYVARRNTSGLTIYLRYSLPAGTPQALPFTFGIRGLRNRGKR